MTEYERGIEEGKRIFEEEKYEPTMEKMQKKIASIEITGGAHYKAFTLKSEQVSQMKELAKKKGYEDMLKLCKEYEDMEIL